MVLTENRNLLLCWMATSCVLSLLLTAGALAAGSTSPYFGVALDGHPLTETRLETEEKNIGAQPDLVVFFLQWPPVSDPEAGVFPLESLQSIWNRGAVPCLTWEPMYFQGAHERAVPWRSILEGAYDSYLISFAEQARAWDKPLIIRLAHEMNIERYHWGTTKAAYGPESPTIYQRIFRYVVDLFNQAGAHNVQWAFCPNAESVPNHSYDPTACWNRVASYYPGNSYVDILGMDGYNWGNTQTKEENGWDSRWKSFRDIFGHLYCELRRLAPEKPIFVFETATVHVGGDRGLWLQEAAETLQSWGIKGLVWFQVEKEQDWRLQPHETRVLGLHTRRAVPSGLQEWILGRTK